MRDRIKSAGFTVVGVGNVTSNPRPLGGFEVPLKSGGRVTIYVHASAADAKKAAIELEHFASNPKYASSVKVTVSGANIYVGTVEQPATLDTSEFQAVVDAGEGH